MRDLEPIQACFSCSETVIHVPKYCAIMTYKGSGGKAPYILALALGRGELSSPHFSYSTPSKTAPIIYQTIQYFKNPLNFTK